ncbi:aminotransferase class V-fold PLP-dependent enzyme [Rhodocytophaga rosea]|uniref:phosphoserine transaminase n=1 Tax=Rhodocytophaga rosea TaxID=2704465 RepID=A0A6C0GG22_9BACT|nr:aminotransferase class V-fold PLP-dependent enzyme [Rhodocytophaga rosea]QHT66630.1 aminotransferase class V-fold PLP-dependent enzyme [Rhodocytophaga rosea]
MQRKVFFTPGPAHLYPTFEKHLQTALDEQIGSISHRSKQFKAIYQYTVEQLRTLLAIPPQSAILFTGSATEIWERVLQSCVEKESFHLVNGAFSKRFYEFAAELGKKAIKQEAPFGQGFNTGQIHIPHSAELVCLTHNETSSGVSMPVEAMHQLKKDNPDTLFVVDIVSSAPYPALDYSLIDSSFFSVQKGFGMPAGLGVWIVNEKCLQKAESLKAKGLQIGTYHSLPSLWSKYTAYETPATPNVLSIYLLGKIAEDMNREGIASIRKQTEEKAALLYSFLEKSKLASVAVQNPQHRSQTVVVADVKQSSAEYLQDIAKTGNVVGSGYGSYKDKQIRIANFPANTTAQVEALIQVMQQLEA